MSFGSRANFCNLKDAFPGIQMDKEYIVNPPIQPHEVEVPLDPRPVVTEHFEPSPPCQHCANRYNYSYINGTFNEILNILLLGMLLYIIIYRPNI